MVIYSYPMEKKGKQGKIYMYFETSFSCFGPFGVWGVTVMISELRL